ncbi:MAG: hypothetical protein VX498_00420 [Myxococcota bacterium]|nr:hypothetical protein [Myxococcota bacterium]
MEHPSDLARISAGGWTARERWMLTGLVLLILALAVLRVETRRMDGGRSPLKADIVVVHIAGLRSDSLAVDDLAADVGLDPDRLLVWSEAFAPSGDSRRSLLSVLAGDLVLNLDQSLGSSSLPAVLAEAGWQTSLVTDGELPPGIPAAFQQVSSAEKRAAIPAAVAHLLEDTPPGHPQFIFVHVGSTGTTLHDSTTDARALRKSYEDLVVELRGTVSRIAQTLVSRDRPRLIAILGASGIELGAHPEAPDRPWDDHLRVPFVLGLQGGSGLPWGEHSAMVQTTDLSPTLLDLLDLRSRSEAAGDGVERTGVSLEGLVHGWEPPPIHERLFFADIGHAAVRTRDWKLISPVSAPWQLRDEAAMLFALTEDPAERFDLAADRPLGPTGSDLLARLREQLGRPETIGDVR